MADEFSTLSDSPISPARNVVAVTPNDSTDLTDLPKCLRVGGAGNVVLIAADDSSSVTFSNCVAGEYIMVRAKRVLATGTTATSILALR